MGSPVRANPILTGSRGSGTDPRPFSCVGALRVVAPTNCQVRAMREKIRLVSTAGTGFFYTTTKNRRNTPEKLLLKKYDPKIRKYVDFKEAKIK